jgi:putative glutamine amidotransferase
MIDLEREQPAEVVPQLDGLLLTGGGDLDPASYGETPTAVLLDVDSSRDRFEIELTRHAMEADLPVLAICRGLQVINVARGGTLVQDIQTEVSAALEHLVRVPPSAIVHEVWITRGSRLWKLMQEKLGGEDTLPVNSRHHQAVRRLAPGFEVSATAPDGIIEAIECSTATFCLAVQWHPENFWRTGEFRPLFEGLADSSSARRSSR